MKNSGVIDNNNKIIIVIIIKQFKMMSHSLNFLFLVIIFVYINLNSVFIEQLNQHCR